MQFTDIQNISGICIFLDIFVLMYFYRLIRKEMQISTVVIIISILIVCLSIPTILFPFNKDNYEQIGAFYEKTDYTADYIVQLQKGPDFSLYDNLSSKEAYKQAMNDYYNKDYPIYNLRATIQRTSHVGESKPYYFIKKIYLNNGEYLEFNKYEKIEPEDKTLVGDKHNNQYYVTLTRIKAD